MTCEGAKHIVLACASGQLGGTELRMLEEGRELQRTGFRVTVATPPFGHGSRYQSLLAESGIRHVEFLPPKILNDWRWRHWQAVRARFADRSLLRSADLLHVFMPWTNQGMDQIWQGYLAGVKTMLSAHNAFTMNDHLSPWHKRHLEAAFSGVRGIYGVSQQSLRSFGDIFDPFVRPQARREVIYNFVDMNRFRPSRECRHRARARLGIPASVPLFGSVGRLDKQKRPLSLLRTFDRIRAALPDAHFLLIGQGDLEARVRQEAEKIGLAEVLRVLPFQNRIEEYFPALDVHLLLSRNEGFGIVTAEALACGVPVVGSRVSGTEEVVGDCAAGRLVPLGDEDAAAGACRELYAQHASLAESARQHVKDRFSREIWQGKIQSFYADMLTRSD